MYYILYASQATRPLIDSDFQVLLNQCHRNNPQRDITGLLLYHNGNFLQIIEGEKEKVEALYNIIYQDPRHHQIAVIEAGEQTGRNFPDWAMGFKAAANGSLLTKPAYIDLSQNQILFNLDGKVSHPALPHLIEFYDKLTRSVI